MTAPDRRPLGGGRRAALAALAVGLLAAGLVAAPSALAAVPGTVSVDNPTVGEGNTGLAQATFTVTFTRTAPGLAGVDYETQMGTAGQDSDYMHETGTVIFGAGETEKKVEIDVVGDLLDEPNETFKLVLTDPDTAQMLATGTATISDDDDPPTVRITDATVDEGDSGTEDATFVVSLSVRSGQAVTVAYATADGTAIAPADYTTTTGTLTFDPGELSEVIQVPVVGDTLNEDNETFTVTLSNAVKARFPGNAATASATGTIVDQDPLPSLTIDDVRVMESGGTASFLVTLSPKSGREVKVTASTADGTAAGSDYQTTSTELVFAPDETAKTFDVPIRNDDTPEAEEAFFVNLTNPEFALVADGTATGVIVDDDKPSLSITSLVEKAEGTVVPGGPFTFEVKLSGASTETVTVRYETTPGTAEAPADYTAVSNGLATFLPGQTTQQVTILVEPDSFVEPNETFSVKLKDPSANAVIAEGAGVGTARIVNDDGPFALITIADVTVDPEGNPNPGASANFTVQLDRPAPQPVTLRFSTQDGTAQAPGDYTPEPAGVVTIEAGQSQGTASVRIEPDAIDEIDETFSVVFSNPTNAAFAPGEDGVAVATIVDDDNPPIVTIEHPVSVVEGNSGPSTRNVEVRLSIASGKTVKVNYITTAGRAEAGKDYGAPAGDTLTFSPGDVVRRIQVAANGDTTDEIDETFTITLSPNPENATLGNPATSTVTILDDDLPPEMTIENAEVVEPEAGKKATVNFAVSLSEESEKQVLVAFETRDGTAKAGTNYTPNSNANFPIPPRSRRALIPVEVLGDGVDTGDLTFTFDLTNPREARFPLLVPTLTATGTILDIDGPPSLSVRDATVAEGSGQVLVAVNLLPASTSDSPVTVEYTTANGSAAAPGDYAAKAGTLSFAKGEMSKTVPIEVVTDQLDEDNETFSVVLSNPDPPTTAIGRATGTVTITDDDGPTISVADTRVDEGDSRTRLARFTVFLSASSPQTVTVAYATSDGTASSPADFEARSGMLTFVPNDTQETVEVTVKGDAGDEGDETFSLGLGSPTNATIGRGVAQAVIADDDGPVVGVGSIEFAEGDSGLTSAVFTVRLDVAPVRRVSFAYDTAAGTARAGIDYLSASGRVTFNAGETEKRVTVLVVGDALPEVAETFRLRLSDPVGVSLGALEAIATILNADRPGYAPVATDGGIFAFGGAEFSGSTGSVRLNQPIVSMAAHLSGRGYWLVASDGGIFTFGDARFHGSTGSMRLNKPIVGMAATPTGKGYWLVATDGGIFTFGDAKFHGSTGSMRLNKPIVGMAATPSGNGYWLVATDGGIFTFGDAKFYGSTGSMPLNQPVVGMAATPTGKGYWLVATDGGIFTFGDAAFKGSTGSMPLNQPVVGMAATPSGNGYWLVATDGGIFTFGDAEFLGSTGSMRLNRPVVGMAIL